MHESEEIHDSKKYQNERLAKEYHINIQLISETSLDHSITKCLSEDEKYHITND